MIKTAAGHGARIALEALQFAYPGGSPMAFDATIAASDIVAVMGPSGSGKSTLLSLIAGFERPASGRILIDGEDVSALTPHRRPVSMVFQENNLFAHLTVAQNVGLGRSPSLKLTEEDRAAVSDALARTGLAGKEDRLPQALSGGERQRVALARVLIRKRPVLLMDEPFASLGPALRDEMLALIAALHAEQKMTVLMATHDPRDAERLCKTMIFVEDGRISATGTTGAFVSGTASEAFNRYIGARREIN
ncbi:thiamine ABC transporter ATP-binding protein [Nitratireductor aquibiodomus RA22]|uniref:Thiamine ABC transporter ATP-binding protein n=1 Tax=Nitratireductor aquibiodomus RA22 TaxID=1189611 RepID=I5C4G2_9HYPH|nr:thiamine ABC transporter ATP-binding protein [Nitratireductor aquibiodomus]EIM76714.1 thiamine ABC transporter ATP-binding protein [Nitratireductor aquibiodomus RA22]